MRMMVMLAAGRAVPLRREVPRRACPEAQGGRAWLPVELIELCLCIGRFPQWRVPRRRRVVLVAGRAGRAVPLRQEVP